MNERAATTPELIRTAIVRRSHGVQGGARVESLGDDPHRFRKGLRLIVEDTGEVLTITTARAVASNEVLLDFKGFDTPEAVNRLRGRYLCVHPEDVRPLADDEWFVWQLVGLTAVDRDGTEIGEVTDVEAGSVHDTLVVNSPGGERRFPMVRAHVERIDVPGGRVTLTPWEEDA